MKRSAWTRPAASPQELRSDVRVAEGDFWAMVPVNEEEVLLNDGEECA